MLLCSLMPLKYFNHLVHSNKHSSCVFIAKTASAALSVSIARAQVSIQITSEAGATKHDHDMGDFGEVET